MVKSIAIIGTLDTKGDQVTYIKEQLESKPVALAIVQRLSRSKGKDSLVLSDSNTASELSSGGAELQPDRAMEIQPAKIAAARNLEDRLGPKPIVPRTRQRRYDSDANAVRT